MPKKAAKENNQSEFCIQSTRADYIFLNQFTKTG